MFLSIFYVNHKNLMRVKFNFLNDFNTVLKRLNRLNTSDDENIFAVMRYKTDLAVIILFQ